MLELQINEKEFFNEETSEVIRIPAQILRFEHSLSSIYDWESKWHKSFLNTKEKTSEEALNYLDCMLVDGNLHGIPVYALLTMDDIKKLNDYILEPMTATTFRESQNNKRDVITAEIIYYWMTAMNVPFECDKWHLNRLLTLIRVCAIRNAPPKKMSKSDIRKRNAALNNSRKAKHNTRG